MITLNSPSLVGGWLAAKLSHCPMVRSRAAVAGRCAQVLSGVRTRHLPCLLPVDLIPACALPLLCLY